MKYADMFDQDVLSFDILNMYVGFLKGHYLEVHLFFHGSWEDFSHASPFLRGIYRVAQKNETFIQTLRTNADFIGSL